MARGAPSYVAFILLPVFPSYKHAAVVATIGYKLRADKTTLIIQYKDAHLGARAMQGHATVGHPRRPRARARILRNIYRVPGTRGSKQWFCLPVTSLAAEVPYAWGFLNGWYDLYAITYAFSRQIYRTNHTRCARATGRDAIW